MDRKVIGGLVIAGATVAGILLLTRRASAKTLYEQFRAQLLAAKSYDELSAAHDRIVAAYTIAGTLKESEYRSLYDLYYELWYA